MKNTKTFSLFIFLLLYSVYSFSQIDFEKGYFIDNNNARIDCLIKNVDWRNNPSEFDYKLLETSAVQTKGIEDVSEFGLLSATKYVKRKIEIDRSADHKQKLGFSPEPEWFTETLFLKVLVEGEVSLFVYQDGEIRRYFIQRKGAEIEQLIRKAYYTEHSNELKWNNSFRQQLWGNFNCADRPMNPYENLAYKFKELTKYVQEENACHGTEGKIFTDAAAPRD